MYQFLALIRLRDGSPLADSRGRITSHLSGLFYRTTRLIADYGIQMVFVFDGKPPALKSRRSHDGAALRNGMTRNTKKPFKPEIWKRPMRRLQ
jgi:flap endonuclease-1